jgi:hypothetical protein
VLAEVTDNQPRILDAEGVGQLGRPDIGGLESGNGLVGDGDGRAGAGGLHQARVHARPELVVVHPHQRRRGAQRVSLPPHGLQELAGLGLRH